MAEPDLTLGSLIDSLGVEYDAEPGDLVTDAFVLLRIVGEDGSERLQTCPSPGLSWITRAGMLHVAQTSAGNGYGARGEDD